MSTSDKTANSRRQYVDDAKEKAERRLRLDFRGQGGRFQLVEVRGAFSQEKTGL